MALDQGFILGQIDAEGLLSRDIAVDPLNIGAEFCQSAAFEVFAAPLSCPGVKDPTFGISRSITNLRIFFLLF